MTMGLNEITGIIIEESISIHRELGPGLMESVYEEALYVCLIERGLNVERQVAIPVYLKGKKLEVGFRADLIVEGLVIIELKSTEVVAPVHYKKLLTYLKLSSLPVGLVINFYVDLLKNGIKRIAN